MRLAGSLATESHIRAMWLLAASSVTKNTAVMPVPSSTTYSRRLSQRDRPIVLVAPPYRPHAPAWAAAGLDLGQLQIIHAAPKQALWAAEQCLRSAACAAVLCWPHQADDRALRRLQVAAETGQTLAFAYRPLEEALNPSPAALRLALEAQPLQLRVLKCRGGLAPERPLAAAAWQ